MIFRFLFTLFAFLSFGQALIAHASDREWNLRAFGNTVELASPFLPELGDHLIFQYGDRQLSSDGDVASLSLIVLKKSDRSLLSAGQIEFSLAGFRVTGDEKELQTWIRSEIEPQITELLLRIPREHFVSRGVHGAVEEQSFLSKIVDWIVPSANAMEWNPFEWDWPGPLEFLQLATLVPAVIAVLYAAGWAGGLVHEIFFSGKEDREPYRKGAFRWSIGTVVSYLIVAALIEIRDAFPNVPKPHGESCEVQLENAWISIEDLGVEVIRLREDLRVVQEAVLEN